MSGEQHIQAIEALFSSPAVGNQAAKSWAASFIGEAAHTIFHKPSAVLFNAAVKAAQDHDYLHAAKLAREAHEVYAEAKGQSGPGLAWRAARSYWAHRQLEALKSLADKVPA